MCKQLIFGLLILALNGGYSVIANAQLLEEIIVTAQKREQNMQDIGYCDHCFFRESTQGVGLYKINGFNCALAGCRNVRSGWWRD